jgi:hypothetical protein
MIAVLATILSIVSATVIYKRRVSAMQRQAVVVRRTVRR